MRNNVVSVSLWDQEIGKLYWDERRRVAVFQFAPDYAGQGIDVAPLTYPLTANAVRRGLPIDGIRERAYLGLPSFICDALPDRWGNEVFTAWSRQQHVAEQDITPVDRLAFMGQRAMGALEFAPAYELGKAVDINLPALYQQAKQILRARTEYAIGPSSPLSLDALYMVGTSAGGQQAKAIIAIDRDNGEIRSGQVMLPASFDYYILKFNHDAADSLPQTLLEMAYHDMAVDAGITMMSSQLIEIEGKQHFLTQRFDRVDGEKFYTQTAFALYPDTTDYDDLFYICRQLGLSAEEQSQLFRRLVFNVLACNCDDHSKNFSFMLRQGGRWQLAPAYDLNFVTGGTGAMVFRHQLTVGGQASGIVREDLLRCAERNDIRGAAKIIDSVANIVDHFNHYAERYGVAQQQISGIETVLHRLAITQTSSTQRPIEDAALLRDKHGWIISIKVNGWWHDRKLTPEDAAMCDGLDQQHRMALAKELTPKYYSAEMG